MVDWDEIRRRLSRPASKMIVGGFRPPDDPFASWFGRVKIAAPSEVWPDPMIPLCQINCAELPYKPAILADIDFLAVFIAPDKLPTRPVINGDGWLLRTYRRDSLTVIDPPLLQGGIKPFPIKWELIEHDFPCWEDVPTSVASKINDDYYDHVEIHHASKVGGWPALIQGGTYSDYDPEPEYIFQIDTEPKAHWMWGDSGTGYFGAKATPDGLQWIMDWQQY